MWWDGARASVSVWTCSRAFKPPAKIFEVDQAFWVGLVVVLLPVLVIAVLIENGWNVLYIHL
jgi:hypothetical protein